MTEFQVLRNMIGRTMVSVTKTKSDARGPVDVLRFVAADGSSFRFYYEPDCCATCIIESVDGDLYDLVGHPLLMAEEVSSEPEPYVGSQASYTWTFYKFATVKGSVTVRWLGESNGYYSERVSYSETLER